MIVAPNSPMAFAKASTAPAITAGAIIGKVTVRNTANRPAPSVVAACSSFGSTPSIPIRIARTISGKAMIAAASTAPVQRNAKTMPISAKNPPTRPCVPKVKSNRYPVTTGGKISGKCTKPLRSCLPQNSRRASRCATQIAKGRLRSVAQNATFNDSATAIHSWGPRPKLIAQ